MRYTLTSLTPLLVGDGQKLLPIDYMVWKDQVNVLDQRRIFKLLSKGPRLDNYLAQLQRADKLDFASWGGFAQNFAGRRIPFEHASSSAIWQAARSEFLHIPTFCSGPNGPYLPASALKGALRTGLTHFRLNPGSLEQMVQRMQGDRPMRSPGDAIEWNAVGSGSNSRAKVIAAGDPETLPQSAFKIYLLRVATLLDKGQAFDLGWKTSPRGSVSGARPQDSPPQFAEMVVPGTRLSGAWEERTFFTTPEIARELGWKSSFGPHQILEAANGYAERLLAEQRQWADRAGLAPVRKSIESLEAALAEARGRPNTCLLCLGWGGGFLSKSAVLDTANPVYRQLLEQSSFYGRAVRTGLPFPKTRKIIFLQNQPAALPGWGRLEVE